jgi:hypothetical protein
MVHGVNLVHDVKVRRDLQPRGAPPSLVVAQRPRRQDIRTNLAGQGGLCGVAGDLRSEARLREERLGRRWVWNFVSMISMWRHKLGKDYGLVGCCGRDRPFAGDWR